MKTPSYTLFSTAISTLMLASIGVSTVAHAEVTIRPKPASADPAQVEFGRPHPEAAPELVQFAFLVGHWTCDVDVLNPDLKSRTTSKATWTAYYALDGRAIMDDFRGGFGDDYIATTIRAYNRGAKQWQSYWLDGQRGTWSRPLVGGANGAGLLFETQMQVQTPDGKVLDLDLEYHFYGIEKNRFQWRQNTSMDGKKTWRKETMRLDCNRLAGPEGGVAETVR